MAAIFGLLLPATGLRPLRAPAPEVGLVLLERLLFDPPRAAATKRWADQLRRTFPNAEFVPYAWHLITHAPEDGLGARATRTLEGPPQAFGHLKVTRETEQAWEVTKLAAEALGAKRVAIRTPTGVSPGVLGRQRLQAFVEARRKEGLEVLWEPQGLWEPLEAIELSRQLGTAALVPAFEGGRPMRTETSAAELVAADAWLRIDGIGRRPRLHPDQIDALCEHLEDVPDAVLIFSGASGVANLRQVRSACDLDEE